MYKKSKFLGAALGVFFAVGIVAYAITNLFFTKSITSELSKKVIFQFDLNTGMSSGEVGPGDSFFVNPVVTNSATEEMYVFVKVNMPTTVDGALYSFDADNEWIPVSDYDGTIIYAYASSEMTALQPGDSTSALTEQMTMDEISNAEYAAIDDINITITGYAIGTEDVSGNPTEAWNQCKLIGNIQ